ncbi:GNAT family N-acetyltransferase [Paenibacillus gallinarum]|uniref:GNAT family N-acetyltransferase n=1 Tax=Paenibacillus gallinarum TaxID=2762232 RepID=A0ABR8SZV6_9BACL|nr:GNAT family N-acetyltransferase [Paenibacillus gallinarum]MBD7969038.1 GNAT family N-acetyltransferase [Paenibacillus gallinarum]
MQPTFVTERLILRPLQLADAPSIQNLAGEKDVASTTLSIPHPYPDGAAESFIAATQERYSKNLGSTFALISKETSELVGCAGMHIVSDYNRAELAYWIGKPYWGHGYATEAARRMLEYGFDELKLNRIWAAALDRNPASSMVMQKIGMKYEGKLVQHIKKWGEYEDLVYYGITISEYETALG